MVKNPAKNGAREKQRLIVNQGLRDILTTLNSNRSLDDILLYLIAQSCRIFDNPIGAIYKLDREEKCLIQRAAQGLDDIEEAIKLPIDWGTPGQAVL